MSECIVHFVLRFLCILCCVYAAYYSSQYCCHQENYIKICMESNATEINGILLRVHFQSMLGKMFMEVCHDIKTPP